ncbi:MAG: carboxypeptidase-like regulatory domain-containing protein, partial [Pseudomonadales bacterium]|nr:carboxypeptidase-like regulatory domain-containing protein [Pseudomonadales bacterium]
MEGDTQGASADFDGYYELEVPTTSGIIVVQAQGYRTLRQEVNPVQKQQFNFEMIEDALGLEEVVVSATRNRVERKSTPVVVSSIKPRLLAATQSPTLAEGLNFAPGVRVET